ncbi:hypothetical protein [Aquimarina sp. MMG016]|uniref:hypothetical protein n=1 Tax=Aquimarina sp. MMG016 TaxID=2822690 RepID=UPI001B3A22BC|nr:hypothetical protein [Aquimarina sp. MMG016]MBQ4822215.1 hypothetical protein [Aquimarina sp. MMG016]
MKKKWYFRILISALAALVVIQQQTVVPNQEIVLEFVDVEVTSLEAQNAIAVVKRQLQSIGVKNTRISKGLKDGKLKITYYSEEDVDYIKGILSEEGNVELSHIFYDQNGENDSFPKKKEDSRDYNLDVYEIQKSTDFDADFNGKYVLEINIEQDGDSSYNLNSFVSGINVQNIDRLVKVAEKVNTNIAIAIDNTFHNIPEVRAGPIS